jgi:two-component system chemotaxis response regulator CheB
MKKDPEIRPRIRVLVVDDSAFMRTALSRMISSDSDLEVAGTACDGTDALEKIASLDPDVVTLDVEMPKLSGLDALRCIMAKWPRPVIMVSATTENNAEITFKALGAGAFDYVPKRLSSRSLDIPHIQTELIAKIKGAAQSARSHSALRPRKPPQPATASEGHASPVLPESGTPESVTPGIVAIGISTGGPKALEEILPVFPQDLSVPLLIVQHMAPGFTASFAQRLNALCSVQVREATHGEIVYPGVVYIAPSGIHMTVERRSALRAAICLTSHPENYPHTPSIDVMMQSVAATFHGLAMGVIMTGMGADGALGMKAIRREGGFTVGQDEASCAVYGMPRVCAESGVLQRVLPLSEIPRHIVQATRQYMRA